MLGYVFQGFYALNSKIFTFRRKTFLLSRITAGAAILNILLNYVLIKGYGVIGAAYSTALSWFIFFMISMFISFRQYPFPVSQMIQGIFKNETESN
jgi:O-antigen/teichoic acid export membrane protein